MAMIEIKWHPDPKELRSFGALWLLFFGGLSAWFYFQGSASWIPIMLGGVACVGGLLGLIVPRSLKLVYVIWMCLAFPIGWLISHILMGVIYFGILLPTGLLLRAVGKDPLSKSVDRDAESYWSAHQDPDTPARYFRQF